MKCDTSMTTMKKKKSNQISKKSFPSVRKKNLTFFFAVFLPPFESILKFTFYFLFFNFHVFPVISNSFFTSTKKLNFTTDWTFFLRVLWVKIEKEKKFLQKNRCFQKRNFFWWPKKRTHFFQKKISLLLRRKG